MHQFNLKFTPVLTSSPHLKIDPFQLAELHETNLDVSTSFHQGRIIACGLNKLCWKYVIDSDTWDVFHPMNYSHKRMPGSVNTVEDPLCDHLCAVSNCLLKPNDCNTQILIYKKLFETWSVRSH
jgi:hypothetical protein